MEVIFRVPVFFNKLKKKSYYFIGLLKINYKNSSL